MHRFLKPIAHEQLTKERRASQVLRMDLSGGNWELAGYKEEHEEGEEDREEEQTNQFFEPHRL